MMDLSTVLKVEAAPGIAPLADPSAVWVDMSQWAQTVKWQRGTRTGGNGGRTTPATAGIKFRDDDAELHAGNPASTLGSDLIRWMPWRISTSDDDGASWMAQYTGFLTNLPTASTGMLGTADVNLVDTLAMVARYNAAGLVRPIELTGQRVAAILTAIGFPALYTGTIASGNVLCAAATLNGNALGLIQALTTLEAGFLSVRGDGKIDWQGRHWAIGTTEANTSQETLDNEWFTEEPIPTSLGSLDPVTRVTATGSSGTPQVYDVTPTDSPPDTENVDASAALFDADAAVLAQHWQEAHEYDGQRIDSVSIWGYPDRPVALTALGDSSAGTRSLDVFHRITVEAQFAGHAAAFSYDATIESILNTVGVDVPGWKADITLSPYDTTSVQNSADWYVMGDTTTSGSVPAI